MRRVLVGLICMLVVAGGTAPVAAAPAPAPVPARVVPNTPVGLQVTWLIDATHHLPISGADAAHHFDAGFLTSVGIDQLNPILAQIAGPGGLSLASYTGSAANATVGVTGANHLLWLLDLSVDPSGLIAGLALRRPPPKSWREIHDRLRALGPDVSFLTARLDHDHCSAVDGLAASTSRPLGSAFKLYVLGALAQAVEQGDAAWDQTLAIRDDWKSLPSGVLQDLPSGTELPLSTYADEMISISDNTAADHLLHFLGPVALRRQQQRFGMAKPSANQPFLTTRELFQLKGKGYPSLANQYLALRRGERSDYLTNTIDPLARSAPVPWVEPRAIDTLEWFASPTDICRLCRPRPTVPGPSAERGRPCAVDQRRRYPA